MLGRLHVVLDVHPARPDPFPLLARVLDGGASVVQIRVKGMNPEPHRDLAARVVDHCRPYGTTVLVNDDPAMAAACGAHGCHVGAQDPPVAAARALLAGGIVGATAREPVAALAAQAAGATYVGVGPAHRSTTKPGLPDPLGPAGVGAVAAAVTIPVIAIGGVTVARVPALLGAGAHGVAVVAAIADATDPTAATAAFLSVLDRHGDAAAGVPT